MFFKNYSLSVAVFNLLFGLSFNDSEAVESVASSFKWIIVTDANNRFQCNDETPTVKINGKEIRVNLYFPNISSPMLTSQDTPPTLAPPTSTYSIWDTFVSTSTVTCVNDINTAKRTIFQVRLNVAKMRFSGKFVPDVGQWNCVLCLNEGPRACRNKQRVICRVNFEEGIENGDEDESLDSNRNLHIYIGLSSVIIILHVITLGYWCYKKNRKGRLNQSDEVSDPKDKPTTESKENTYQDLVDAVISDPQSQISEDVAIRTRIIKEQANIMKHRLEQLQPAERPPNFPLNRRLPSIPGDSETLAVPRNIIHRPRFPTPASLLQIESNSQSRQNPEEDRYINLEVISGLNNKVTCKPARQLDVGAKVPLKNTSEETSKEMNPFLFQLKTALNSKTKTGCPAPSAPMLTPKPVRKAPFPPLPIAPKIENPNNMYRS